MMNTKTEDKIKQEYIEKAFSYSEYQELIDNLLEENKTTGDNHSDSYLHYTKMNVQRMSRLDKRIKLSDELKEAVDGLDEDVTFLALTEAWCGDAAQNLPLFHKLEEYSDHIELKLLLRDENLDLMDQFLTNGGRSIPKVIALESDTLSVKWDWGPRPAKLQEKYLEAKKDPDFDYKETAKDIQLWYAKDKTETLQKELVELLK